MQSAAYAPPTATNDKQLFTEACESYLKKHVVGQRLSTLYRLNQPATAKLTLFDQTYSHNAFSILEKVDEKTIETARVDH